LLWRKGYVLSSRCEKETFITIRVVDGPGPSLLGRDLMAKVTLPWRNIFSVTITAQDVMKDYASLFDTTTIGKLEGVQVSLRVNEEKHVFMKAKTAICDTRAI